MQSAREISDNAYGSDELVALQEMDSVSKTRPRSLNVYYY